MCIRDSLVAECGAVLPSEGGVYVWVREAFGEFWGFQAGWWGTVSTYIANGTYVSLVAGYVSQLIPMSPLADQVLKIGMVLIFTVINLLGIKEVEKVSTTLSVMIPVSYTHLRMKTGRNTSRRCCPGRSSVR